ncbi:MAG TPA: ABC transporter ATP-binding protein [Candidatus Copromonas faecavium]|uniref:ABC transporter ATP-binding protein n=1 Tax=Candidatus Copromonas faecavium (nom. illeg.) TaxID=2840740 RepID=A0A9D1D7B6_9FIRM|nr:ABC transporter ATP-binding protein [Candidatus Copromonas faecavium]
MRFEVLNGSFGYGRSRVLQNISFCLEDQEILAVLGPNGVGKTTLLKCMMGLLKWKEGVTVLDGKNISDLRHSELWKRIAYVPQSKGISLSYTALEMVLMGRSSRLGLFTQPSREDLQIAKEAMEEVGVLFLQDKPCSQMSGGELQMVLIARALCTQPEMLVLDEPESNLDFKNQLVILDIVKKLSRERGIAAIINTHYPAHALKIADKALILNRAGSSFYGAAGDVITEEHMRTAFSVEVKIADYCHEEKHYYNVIPIRAVEDTVRKQAGS